MKKQGQGFFSDYQPGKAAPAPAPSGGGFFSGTAPAQSAPSTSGAVQAGPVAKMQAGLIDLYRTLETSAVKDFFGQEKEVPDEYSKEFKQGPGSFLKFMLDRYIDKAKINAKQYDLGMSDAKYYADPEQQKPRSSFVEYLDMLKTVGRHSTTQKVQVPDGQWGDYTSNALKAAWSIGYAMVGITKRLGEKFSLTHADLDAFKNLLKAGKSNENAQKLDKLIQKIKAASSEFVRLMMAESGKYGEFTSQGKKFNVFGTQEVSQEDKKKIAELVAARTPVPGVSGSLQGLTFQDIQSMSLFRDYVRRRTNNQNPDAALVGRYLEALKQQLSYAVEQTSKGI